MDLLHVASYLDDLHLICTLDQVAEVLQRSKRVLQQLGAELSIAKSALVPLHKGWDTDHELQHAEVGLPIQASCRILGVTVSQLTTQQVQRTHKQEYLAKTRILAAVETANRVFSLPTRHLRIRVIRSLVVGSSEAW